MIIGYARVSTKDQTTETQIQQLKALGCERIYQEAVSGKDAERKELKACMDFCREGDTLIVMKVDRIARRTIDALEIADKLKAKGVGLKCMDLGDIDINSDMGRVIYTTIAAFAEMERKRILQRSREGIERAKAEGKHMGRPSDVELRDKILRLHSEGMAKLAISKALGCSRTTVYKVLAA